MGIGIGIGLKHTALPPVSLPIPSSHLLVFLRADKGITTDGSGNVSAWADQSGNGADAGQATPASRPALSATGWGGTQPAVVSTLNAGTQLVIPSLTMGAFTLGFVGSFAAGSSYVCVHDSDGTPGFYLFTSTGKTMHVARVATGDGADYVASWWNDNAKKSVIVTYDGTDVGFQLYVNGTAVTLSGDGLNPGASALTAAFYLFGNQTANGTPNGKLVEFEAYDRVLTGAEITSLHGWHVSQWGTP